jgi:hypothetical protein
MVAWVTSSNGWAAQPPVKVKNVSLVAIGNSQTHPLRWLEPLSTLSGHPGYKHVDISILGTPMRGNYEHPEWNHWTERLNDKTRFDVIVVYVREDKSSQNDVYAVKWLAEAQKANPQCQMFIQQGGPTGDMDWQQPPWERTQANAEWVADAVAKACPLAPKPRIIPESLLRCELGRLADRGELPGVVNHYELMGDTGHLNDIGQYGLLTLTASMLYQEPPFAYPTDIYRTDPKGKPIRGMYQSITVPTATADVIKRAAWDILQTYPPSGIKSGLVIVNRHLDPVVAGQPCDVALEALGAAGTCKWSLAQGMLPEGLALSPQGRLSGKCNRPGEYPVTIKVADGASAAERELAVTVASDIPPVIVERPLAETPLGGYVFQTLKSEGGVGHVTWSLAQGTLPYGIRLAPAGILTGSPGESGDFSFAVKATDSRPVEPRSMEKAMTWKIGPAAADTLRVRYVMKEESAVLAKEKRVDRTFLVDGKLDEAFWRLDQPIERAVKGMPTRKAVFGAVWTTEPSLSARTRKKTGSAQGAELLLGVKVMDGPKGKTPKDGIHIYIDGRHDGGHTYAADDTHFFIPRDNRRGAVWISGKVNWFIKAAIAETEGGYTAEVSLSAVYFEGDGNWLRFGAKRAYGFDLGVDEGDADGIARQVWRGDANNDADTSRFGTIVLLDEPATAASPVLARPPHSPGREN